VGWAYASGQLTVGHVANAHVPACGATNTACTTFCDFQSLRTGPRLDCVTLNLPDL
jgi:hypothetical protein